MQTVNDKCREILHTPFPRHANHLTKSQREQKVKQEIHNWFFATSRGGKPYHS